MKREGLMLYGMFRVRLNSGRAMMCKANSRKRAFTLIELLVVIAIIALLLSIIMPSLSMVKKKAAAILCLSNTGQMSLGTYMYQEENDGLIMSAEMENVGENNVCKASWIGMPHTDTDTTSTSLSLTQTSPPVTDEDEIRGLEKGKLFPYMENPSLYHCPADRLREGPDGTKLYVSYAIPTCLNGFPSSSSAYYKSQIRKLGQITSPAIRYLFVESGERNRGNWIVGGHFIMATPEYGDSGYGLWSPLAISHGNSGEFGFVDGHSDSHKWHDEVVFEHYTKTEGTAPGATYGKTMLGPGESKDFDWLVRGWAYRDNR